jgi:hypothetical protein
MIAAMYGVLHSDGQLNELPDVDSACIEDEELVCYDAQDRVIARFAAPGALFGHVEMLQRLASSFKRLSLESEEAEGPDSRIME